MNNSVYQSKIIFKMNERLFKSTLEGLSEQQAKERIAGHVNPVNWIASHTVWARYNTLMFLGKPAEILITICSQILKLTTHRYIILHLQK